jgi:regulator of protease activity HflC (stomatin/prohibitin superfamily)
MKMRDFTAAWLGALARASVFVVRALAAVVLVPVRLAQRLRTSRPARKGARFVLAGARVALGAAALAALALAGGWLFTERIPLGCVGVKQINFGGGGIVARDFDTGLAFSLRGYHSWHLVDRRTRVLTFAWESDGGDRPMLEVRTRDGNVAQVGASIPWRVRTGEAHLLVRDGLKSAYPQRTRATIEKVLLEELASLSTDDLSRTETRLAKADEALPKLNALLAQYHVEAESILITQVWFGAEYEKKLQQKQLTHQEALLSNAGKLVDRERQSVELFKQGIDASEKSIRADMDKEIEQRFAGGRMRIAEIQAESKYYAKTRRAAAQAEYDKLVAEGERSVAQAESLKDSLTNESLETQGGRLVLARRAAENLNIKQVTLNSNDPRVPSVLDLDELVRLLIGPRDNARQ